MGVLILKNKDIEGPGTLGDFLQENAFFHRVVEPGDIGSVDSLEGYDTLVVMGGPMGMYEMDRHPHLKAGVRLMERALKDGKRLLGVCLGAQMMAHVLGGSVYKGPAEEVGWLDVELTDEGACDPAVGMLAEEGRKVKVFHWHGDTFDMPEGAVRLAGSALYENQAFRYGDRAYGLQFHIEVNESILEEWFADSPLRHKVLEDTMSFGAGCIRKARGFYERFFA